MMPRRERIRRKQRRLRRSLVSRTCIFVQIYPVSTLSQDMRKCGPFILVWTNVGEPKDWER